MQELKRFNEDLHNNKDMKKDLKALHNDLEKIVEYANSKGYNFSIQDLEQSTELTEEELSKISGGYKVAGF